MDKTFCKDADSVKAMKCQREEQCDDCFMVDHEKECEGCSEYEHNESLPPEAVAIGLIHKNYPNIMHGSGSRCPIEFCPRCLELDEPK